MSVVRVLEIPQVGIDLDVFVRPIVAIEVAHDGQIGRVADPQVASVPGKPLDGIQAGGKCLGGVSDPVTIGIDQHDDRVAGRIRFGIPHAVPARRTDGRGRRTPSRWDYAPWARGQRVPPSTRKERSEARDGSGLTDEPVAPRAVSEQQRGEARASANDLRPSSIPRSRVPRSGACVMECLVFRVRPIVTKASDVRVVSGAHAIASIPRP